MKCRNFTAWYENGQKNKHFLLRFSSLSFHSLQNAWIRKIMMLLFSCSKSWRLHGLQLQVIQHKISSLLVLISFRILSWMLCLHLVEVLFSNILFSSYYYFSSPPKQMVLFSELLTLFRSIISWSLYFLLSVSQKTWYGCLQIWDCGQWNWQKQETCYLRGQLTKYYSDLVL